MYRFSPLEVDCDERDENGSGYAFVWADLDTAFYSWLRMGYLVSMAGPCLGRRGMVVCSLTHVADMPGYPTRKLLFGGPETRTKADVMFTTTSFCAVGWVWVCATDTERGREREREGEKRRQRCIKRIDREKEEGGGERRRE